MLCCMYIELEILKEYEFYEFFFYCTFTRLTILTQSHFNQNKEKSTKTALSFDILNIHGICIKLLNEMKNGIIVG